MPKYNTVSYVKAYRYQTRRVPSYRGWRTIRQRVPVYGSKRIKVGTETKWRRVPKYVKKEVPDGFHTIARTKPVYALKEKVVGYKTVEKRVPKMVEKQERVGTKTEWVLGAAPNSRSHSAKKSQDAKDTIHSKIHYPFGDLLPDASYSSIGVTVGIGPLFWVGSLDSARTANSFAIFYSKRSINSPSELALMNQTDDLLPGVTPQISLSYIRGVVWGDTLKGHFSELLQSSSCPATSHECATTEPPAVPAD